MKPLKNSPWRWSRVLKVCRSCDSGNNYVKWRKKIKNKTNFVHLDFASTANLKKKFCATSKIIFVIFFSLFSPPVPAFLCAILTLLSIKSLTVCALSVEPREVYFNGSAYLRLKTPMVLWGHSAISFRTCRGKSNTRDNDANFSLYWCSERKSASDDVVWVEHGSGWGNIANNWWTRNRHSTETRS